MDPSLIKEHEAFIKRARCQPIVEKRKFKSSNDDTNKKPKSSKSSLQRISRPLDYKTAQVSSQYRFSVLARIVKHMKDRHHDGDTGTLLLEEILDETSQLDISLSVRNWLLTEALVNNPKLSSKESAEGLKFIFKPTLDIRDRKGLVRLLRSYNSLGSGGIRMDDVEESLPNALKAIKGQLPHSVVYIMSVVQSLGDHITVITRPVDKKKILFYNDKSLMFSIDEGYVQLWRSVSVDGLDEHMIADYLSHNGITSMCDSRTRRVSAIPRRKKGICKKAVRSKWHNEHVADILKDYSTPNDAS